MAINVKGRRVPDVRTRNPMSDYERVGHPFPAVHGFWGHRSPVWFRFFRYSPLNYRVFVGAELLLNARQLHLLLTTRGRTWAAFRKSMFRHVQTRGVPDLRGGRSWTMLDVSFGAPNAYFHHLPGEACRVPPFLDRQWDLVKALRDLGFKFDLPVDPFPSPAEEST